MALNKDFIDPKEERSYYNFYLLKKLSFIECIAACVQNIYAKNMKGMR